MIRGAKKIHGMKTLSVRRACSARYQARERHSREAVRFDEISLCVQWLVSPPGIAIGWLMFYRC